MTGARLKWKRYPATRVGGQAVQAPLVCAGDYVISCRPQQYSCSYRPEGEHHHVAQCTTLAAAKKAAQAHFEAAANGSKNAARPWNWCHKCRQEVDVDAGSSDGSEHRCLGCRRAFVLVELTDGTFALEVRR